MTCNLTDGAFSPVDLLTSHPVPQMSKGRKDRERRKQTAGLPDAEGRRSQVLCASPDRAVFYPQEAATGVQRVGL